MTSFNFQIKFNGWLPGYNAVKKKKKILNKVYLFIFIYLFLYYCDL